MTELLEKFVDNGLLTMILSMWERSAI